MSKKTLNRKQKLFCKHYIFDWNATRAYKLAYRVKSDNVAAVCAAKLLRNAKVLEYIEKIQGEIEKNLNFSKHSLVQKQLDIAMFKIDDIFDDWETLKPFEEIPERAKHAIKDVRTKTTTTFRKENGKSVPVITKERFLSFHNPQPSIDSIFKVCNITKEAETNVNVSLYPNLPFTEQQLEKALKDHQSNK